jgi:hypothetical protein
MPSTIEKYWIETGELVDVKQARLVKAGYTLAGHDSIAEVAEATSLSYHVLQKILNRDRAVPERYADEMNDWLENLVTELCA